MDDGIILHSFFKRVGEGGGKELRKLRMGYAGLVVRLGARQPKNYG